MDSTATALFQVSTVEDSSRVLQSQIYDASFSILSMGAHPERVAVIMPALNEAEAVGPLVHEIHSSLSQHPHDILVVDGRSTDGTVEKAKEAGARVMVQRGTGYGDALICGFGYALRHLSPDIVVMMDADGTYPPQDINALLEPILKDKSDFVIGNRFLKMEKGAMSFRNRVGNRLFSFLSKHMFRISSLDTQSGFRAFKAEILSNLVFKNPGMPFASEMIIEAKNANYRIVQVPITYRARLGKSKLRPATDGILILGTLIRLYRDYSPLFFFGAMGLFFLITAAVLTLYLLINYVAWGLLPGYAQTMTASVMFLSGLVVLIMALLADMIKDLRERLRVFEMQMAESLWQNNKKARKDEEEPPDSAQE